MLSLGLVALSRADEIGVKHFRLMLAASFAFQWLLLSPQLGCGLTQMQISCRHHARARTNQRFHGWPQAAPHPYGALATFGLSAAFAVRPLPRADESLRRQSIIRAVLSDSLDDQKRCDKHGRTKLCVPVICAPQRLAFGREVFWIKVKRPSAGEASSWVAEISSQPKVEGEMSQHEDRKDQDLESTFAQRWPRIWMEAA
jgi:hypothetical protein